MDFDSRKMLNLYIYDYLVKANMLKSAESFAREADLHPESFVVPPIEGFLVDWWCIFWDVYCTRLNRRQAAEASSAQTPQTARGVPQNVHPILPASTPDANFMLHHTSPVMPMPGYANLLPTVRPTTFPRPDMPNLLLPTVDRMTTLRPDMRNLLHDAFPMMLPRTEFNSVTFISNINMVQLQSKTNLIVTRMSEQVRPRPPARDIYTHVNLPNVNRLSPVLPSKHRLSQPQKKDNNKRKLSVTKDNNIGTCTRGSTSAGLTLRAPAPRLVKNNIGHADTGSSTSSNSMSPDTSS